MKAKQRYIWELDDVKLELEQLSEDEDELKVPAVWLEAQVDPAQRLAGVLVPVDVAVCVLLVDIVCRFAAAQSAPPSLFLARRRPFEAG